MPEEHEKKEEREDADAGTLLKTAIDRLDSLHKRMDAMEDSHRKDAEKEEEEPEPVAADKRKRKDSEKEEEEKKADARKKKDDDDDDDSTVFYRGNKAPTRKKTDARSDDDDDDRKKDDDDDDDSKRHRKDDDDDDARHKKDARRRDDDDDDSKKKDDSRRKKDDDDDDDARRMRKADDDDDRRDDDDDDSRKKDDDDDRKDSRRADSSISRRIDRVEKILSLSDEQRAAYSEVQADADEIYHAFGSRAPSPMQGETLLSYRQRIATKLKEHSPTWKDVNIYAIADAKAFQAIERTIYSDALTVAHSPATVEPGTLRMITKASGGHEIHTFEGEPRAWMDSMAGPVRMHVTSINTPNNGSTR